MAVNKKREPIEPEGHFGSSVVGRALQRIAEGKPALASDPALGGTELKDLPALAETAWMNEDGTIRVKFVTYDGPQSPNKMDGEYELEVGSDEYIDVLKRHPHVSPTNPSSYARYHDGRVEVS